MSERVILLTSDVAGEDSSYTIGAVLVPEDISTDTFEREAIQLMDKIREQDTYDDDELLDALERRGYQTTNPPETIVVRK